MGFGGRGYSELTVFRPKLGDGTLYFDPRVETLGYYFGHPYGIFLDLIPIPIQSIASSVAAADPLFRNEHLDCVLAAGMVEEAILSSQNLILSDSAFSRMAEFDYLVGFDTGWQSKKGRVLAGGGVRD